MSNFIGRQRLGGGLSSIPAGCVKSPCDPWEYPEHCCDVCEDPQDWELFNCWWEAVTEWLFQETCCRFPGCCPVESVGCAPCGCPGVCGCGPYQVVDLSDAFCYPLCVPKGGDPCIEFVFGDGDGGEIVVGPSDGFFEVRPDLVTVDWCYAPPVSDACGLWPQGSVCDELIKVRALVGCEPPKMLLQGAAAFVCEIVKECLGKPNCLPDNVRSITRRGITADIGEGFSETVSFDTKGTGIPTLDFALRRWGNCDERQAVRGFVSMADRLKFPNGRDRWVWRGKLNPTPPSCAP